MQKKAKKKETIQLNGRKKGVIRAKKTQKDTKSADKKRPKGSKKKREIKRR